MSSVARVRGALHESVAGLPRAFWWLWTSTLINRLGGFVYTFMAIYLTVERGYSASYAGLVAALFGLGGVLASLIGGVLTDRWGRRPTMFTAQAGTALAVAVLGFVTHPVAIAGVAAVVGFVNNAARPAVRAMLADLVPPEDRVRAFALNYWAINLGFAVSSVLAGFVAEYSYLAGFLGDAALTMACAVVVFLKLPETRPEHAGSDKGARADEVGLRTVARDGRFMAVVGLSFLVALIFQEAQVGLPIMMGQAGFSPADYGSAIALNGVLIVVLQIPLTRFIAHRSPGRLLVLSSLLAGYGLGLTAFADSMAVLLMTITVWTLAEMVNAPTQTGLVVQLSPVRGRGRYQGVYGLSWSAAALVAPLMAGAMIDHLGAGWLWGSCAVLGTVAGAGYGVVLRTAKPSAGSRGRLSAGEPDARAREFSEPGLCAPERPAPDVAAP
ncbi:MDR family MFS transporter [Streptomyces sp. SPB074]|uniref:MDR family MFS transporter n=1 Tax=Streptomyces sp. (strain SPB074) TaxID=465543 RepID=UPI00017F10E4|nr:MFS transporter [Streptomyces sp. SPB074]EDY46077.1 major facilitator family transporter [Streptomyces sp. SPB074]